MWANKVLLPSQVGHEHWSGQQRMQEALDCLMKSYLPGAKRDRRRLGEEVYDWFMSDAVFIGSFVWVCDVLSLDVEFIRSGILRNAELMRAGIIENVERHRAAA